MDAEQSKEFDDALEEAASGKSRAQAFDERAAQMRAMGGQVN
jgi:hypothetical protein